MRYRLLALDVDGTLLTTRGHISPETRKAIRQAMAAGVQVTLATGRVFPSAWLYARQLGLTGPLVVSDGAVIAQPEPAGRGEPANPRRGGDPAPGPAPGGARPHPGAALGDGMDLWRPQPIWGPVRPRILDLQAMDPRMAQEITGLLVGRGVPVVVQFPDHLATNRRVPFSDMIRNLARSHLAHFWAMRRHVRYLPGEQLVRYVGSGEPGHREPVKLSALGEPHRLQPLEEELKERFANKLRLSHSGPGSFDVLAAGVCKGRGLERLAARLGVPREAVIAIGDHENDREMLQWAGLGVAMGNAAPEVQRWARWVTRTNDQDGVAEVIRRFILDVSRDGGGGPLRRPL